ncbi:MAG TPA: NAD(P)-dependent oxidoreductase [Bryobacteraceae bacterium]|nr:NAD(P)-dependent oxidoreductase [Bryobacteraceae bacterium]
MSESQHFRVAFSADFLDERRQLVFPDIGLRRLDAEPGLKYDFLADYRPEYTPEQLAPYDVLITLKPKVTAASLAGVERLTAIGRCGVGYDNVDVEACTRADVALYITPEAVRRPMAESIVLFVLALSHNLVWKDRLIRQGRWVESTRRLGREPRGRVLGTIGLGGIGAEAVRLLRPFGLARILAYDPFVDPARAGELGVDLVSLDELLAGSDYVLVNCPLTAQTRHLIGAPELARMKPDAALINTARGPIVEETALVHALETGVIRAAALDVFEAEPLRDDSPLLRLENVILTSHSVGWTEELFRDMGATDCEGALAIFHGHAPASVVNREVLGQPGFRRKLARYGGGRERAES